MTPAAATTNHDVIIVGGGPVGLALAIDLALKGVRSLVLERSVQLHQIPKGQNLTQRTGEHFRYWGVTEQIRAASPIPRSFGNAGMVSWGHVLSDYTYDWFKRGSVNDFYFAENERLPQFRTEQVLRKRAAQLETITTVYGATVQHIEQFDDYVQVRWTTPETDQSELAQAHYLVGCDGSRSMTREAAGITQDVDPHDKRMVLLVLRSLALHELLERYPGKSIFNVLNPNLDGYWQFLGRMDLDGGWFFHAPVPADTTKENFDFTAYLHDVIGAPFALDIEHIGFWDLRLAVARQFQAKRIFIAGDAAHSHPPYGGYGVNLGFEDARNLSWKLAAQINGWAGPNLLASYEAERKPVVQSTLYDFVGQMISADRTFGQRYSPERDLAVFEKAWQERASGGNDAVTEYLPHYEGSPICFGGGDGQPGAKGQHLLAARAGHHLAPIAATTELALDANTFAVIAAPTHHALARDIAQVATQYQIPFSLQLQKDSLTDYQAGAIVIRPDGFIGWAGNECADIASLVRTITGR